MKQETEEIITMKTIRILAALCFSLIILCSCSDIPGNVPDSTGGVTEAKKITPADFAEGDIEYILKISDGKRSVTLSVSRKGGVTEAYITSPEALSTVTVVSDAGGVRIVTESGESLSLTETASAGMRGFFDAMAHEPAKSEKTAEGMYRFEVAGYEAELLLSQDGYPRLVSLTKDGYTRHGEVSFPEDVTS